MEQPFADWLDGIGTYLKAIWYPDSEALLVLYLRPQGRFLFAGYWSGYAHSIAAGQWLKQGMEVSLIGHGHHTTDAIPGPGSGAFHRVFSLDNSSFTPTLLATGELDDGSLLGWKGPFEFVGRHTVIDPDGRWLPSSMSDVDARIKSLLGG